MTVTVRWSGRILGVEHLKPGRDLVIGGPASRWTLPDPHQGQPVRLIRWDAEDIPWLFLDPALEIEGELWHGENQQLVDELLDRDRLELSAQSCASLQIGALSFDIECNGGDAAAIERPRLNWRSLAIHGMVGLAAMGALTLSHASTPVDWHESGREVEREEVAHQYWLRIEQRVQEAQGQQGQEHEVALGNSDNREGGTGTRARGEEGSMGNSSSPLSGNRYGVSGPRDTSPPHIRRQQALRDAAEFGMTGLMNSGAGGDPDAPTAPWGRDDSLGAGTGRVIAPGGHRDHGVNAPTNAQADRISTFAIDVDTGSYTLARKQLRQNGLPPASSVRVEEFINYFDYDYEAPPASVENNPLMAHIHAAPSPYEPGHHLVRVALQAKRPDPERRKPVHLVYLVDTSGSMQAPDKLPLAQQSLRMLTHSLRPGDTVALCTYAGSTREIIGPTDVRNKQRILQAIHMLQSGGGTAMNSGIATAYRLANASFVRGHVNRVVVLSDGDANVGPNSPRAILETIREYRSRGITLSTIGLGMGNYRDHMMEKLADAGDGNYSYIDTRKEAERVFSEQVSGLLEVVAKDVKLQVEFDPQAVRSYRLLGYENRDVADKDFRNDAVDGGEVGMGHNVTALYDVILRDSVDSMRGDGWVQVRVRHKQPDGHEASESVFTLDSRNVATTFGQASRDFRLAVAVGGFAEILRRSPYAREWQLGEVARITAGLNDRSPEVAELGQLIGTARLQLRGRAARIASRARRTANRRSAQW